MGYTPQPRPGSIASTRALSRVIVAVLVVFAALLATPDRRDAVVPSAAAAAGRDVLLQPFASTSIWNVPIGSGAVYVPAFIPESTAQALAVDEDVLILDRFAPATPVHFSADGWSGGDRCDPQQFLYSVPVPADFEVPGAQPDWTPNFAAAILMPDGRTLKQAQPFTRCTPGGPATVFGTGPDADIYGDGRLGAHGGSGLSSVGGTIRLAELVPGGEIRHALKIELQASIALSPSSGGYRWPAVHADSCAPGCYGGATPALRMGALLALPANLDINGLGLTTEPARMLAWTLQNYGAYVVDDTGWSVYAFATEFSPAGDVQETFIDTWGFSMTGSKQSAWGRDMDRIFASLAVVDNNSASTVGGGGTPRQPFAPDVAPPADGDADGLPDDVETNTGEYLDMLHTGTDPTDADTDADGCGDGRELGWSHGSGGQRDPLDADDFFDVPVPYSAVPTQTGKNRAVNAQDVLAVRAGTGHVQGDGVYNSQYDRTPDRTQRWRSGPPDGAITAQDVLTARDASGDVCA